MQLLKTSQSSGMFFWFLVITSLTPCLNQAADVGMFPSPASSYYPPSSSLVDTEGESVNLTVGGDDNGDKVLQEIIQEIGGLNGGSGNLQLAEVDLGNCSTRPSLANYCPDLQLASNELFDKNASVSTLLATLFEPEVVTLLQTSCTPGNWCLPEYFNEPVGQILDNLLLSNTICLPTFWDCLTRMLELRFQCEEEDLYLLTRSLILLCNLDRISEDSQQCNTRTLEALYVVYSNMTLPSDGNQTQSVDNQGSCLSYESQVTETYLCAFDSCNIDQQEQLREFEYFQDTAASADNVIATCNINRRCATPTVTPSDTPAPNDTLPEGDYTDGVVNELEKILGGGQDQDQGDTTQETGVVQTGDDGLTVGEVISESTSLLQVGLIVLVAGLVLTVLAVAVLGYKHRTRCAGYQNVKYAKLPGEEEQLLRAEYS